MTPSAKPIAPVYLGGRFGLSSPVAIGDTWTHVPFDTVSNALVPNGVHLDAGDLVVDTAGVMKAALNLVTGNAMMVSGVQVRFVLNPDSAASVSDREEESKGLASSQKIHADAYRDVVVDDRLRIEAQVIGAGSVNVDPDEQITNLMVTIYAR